jgi:RNA polymerase sigma-70 factor (ECF subfamily)
MESSLHEARWRDCYLQLAPKLLLYARQWVGSMADAEDVVQSAFVRFWRHQPDAGSEHHPLLYAAVRSSALDLLRAHDRRTRREADDRVGVVRGDELTCAQIAEAVDESINTIASRYRYGLEALRRHLEPTDYERV